MEANGLRFHVAEQGSGPLVLFLHGFPECWYSWRHQLPALAAAGYHAVALDQRGYARSDAPADIDQYTMLHLVGDVIAVIDALGAQQAVVVGHDWGAPVAWTTAQFRPDRVRAVVGMSVPHRPRGSSAPLAAIRRRIGEGFYQVYFQQPGVADAELAADPRTTFRRLLYAGSGEGPPMAPVVPEGGGFLDTCAEPDELPGWLTAEDIEIFAGEFVSNGFTGGLNWYRNIDRNWELTAAWGDAPVTPPAMYLAGTQDLVVKFPGSREFIENLSTFAPGLRRTVMLPGCGHWTQQERPTEVNAALVEFLQQL